MEVKAFNPPPMNRAHQNWEVTFGIGIKNNKGSKNGRAKARNPQATKYSSISLSPFLLNRSLVASKTAVDRERKN